MTIENNTYGLALAWIEEVLNRHTGRIAALAIKRREFVFSGIRWKCGDGPWRESLIEAIAAHQMKVKTTTPDEVPCAYCQGYGYRQDHEKPCTKCSGTGKVKYNTTQ